MKKKDKIKILYLGLEPPLLEGELFHLPVIEVVPLPIGNFTFSPEWTHLIFTSKTSVQLLPFLPPQRTILAVGRATKRALEEKGLSVAICPEEESQEGVVKELQKLDLRGAHIFFPHSARSRPLITNYLKEIGCRYTELLLYTVQLNKNLPSIDLASFDQAIFTSPSTVEAFFTLYPKIPQSLECLAIGPVTKKSLEGMLVISK